MTSPGFGQSNTFGTPVPDEPPAPVVEEPAATSRRPLVLAAVGAAAVLAAVGAWFLAPGVFGSDDEPVAAEVPSAAQPEVVVEPEVEVDTPTVAAVAGRNPFLALVTDGGAAVGSGSSETDITGVGGAGGTTSVSGGTAGGSAGLDGAPGADGLNGLDGLNGTQGTQGAQGAQGAQGPQGVAGPAGSAAEFLTVTYRGPQDGEEVDDPDRAEFELVSLGGTETTIVAELAALSTDATSPASAYRFYEFEADTDLQSVRVQLGEDAFYVLSLDQPVTFAVPVATD